MRRSTWEKPTRETQPTLFPEPTPTALASLRVSTDDCDRWRRAGWLSFDCRHVPKLDATEIYELEFIRDLVRSGLSDGQINEILKDLPKPYAYNPRVVAYNFTLGWVQAPVVLEIPEPEDVIDEHLEPWVDSLAEDGDRERLDQLLSLVQQAIGRCAREMKSK